MAWILAQSHKVLYRETLKAVVVGALALLAACAGPQPAEANALPAPVSVAATRASGHAAPPGAALEVRGAVAPRVRGHLSARELGLVINTADPYSVQVGEYYARARGLGPTQVLRVVLPVRHDLGAAEFRLLAAQIADHFGEDIQALALAWNQPYAVGCQSITGALTLGLDASLCSRSCAATPKSRYFNAASARPWTDLRLRPSMLLAAGDVGSARALIQRGVAADHSLGWRGAPPVQALFVATSDAARSVRARLFPPPGPLRGMGVDVEVARTDTPPAAERLLIYETGAAHLAGLSRLQFVPGALADHLTSFGGQLDGRSGQTSVLAWIGSGATASYGTVSEPCNHPQKFPHPQLLLLHYLQGSTAIEAYWKSVAWPSQGLFVGEPLAAPFARPLPPPTGAGPAAAALAGGSGSTRSNAPH